MRMNSSIKRRKLGRTGLFVTELSFGAMNLRLLDSLEQADEILDFVLDQGINLIDTARAYNGENKQGQMVESEVLVGNAIRRRTDLTEPIVVITKGHGYTPDEFRRDLGTSLAKLGIEGKGSLKIGSNAVKLVYFFHGINDARWKSIQESGALELAQEYKEKGIINHIGFSSHYNDAPEIREALDTGVFDVIELPYNLFNRSLGEDGAIDLLKYAYDKNVGIINMKAFNGNGMVPIYQMLKGIISIDYRTMLNFCLTNPYITAVDAGAKYVSEFRQDLETAAGDRFSQDEVGKYKAEADTISADMNGICRECMHCMEKFCCPQGVDFPTVLSLYSRYSIGEKLNKDTSDLFRLYGDDAYNAGACIECGQCLEWCEYKLDIPNMLKKARDIFENKGMGLPHA
jgi:predicted aldo/keto reductase-like oxidoreductase